jgi:hypothetical protein
VYVTSGQHAGLREVRLHHDATTGDLSVWIGIGWDVHIAVPIAELPQLMVALDEAREQAELAQADETSPKKDGTLWTAKLMPIVEPPKAEVG